MGTHPPAYITVSTSLIKRKSYVLTPNSMLLSPVPVENLFGDIMYNMFDLEIVMNPLRHKFSRSRFVDRDHESLIKCLEAVYLTRIRS